MELFRGYVKTKNKKCIDKFKDVGDLRTLAQVQKFDEYAGVLSADTVLIDIDDAEQSEILMNIVEEKQLNCLVRKTTRGRHFFFKNNGRYDGCKTHIKLACGIDADIKAGTRASYAVIKFDGRERPIEWDAEPAGQYDAPPAFLYPVKSNVDFIGMKNGDGRDNALFSYILTLQTAGIDKSEIIECIKVINDHILADKMSAQDIDRITRDNAFNAPIFFSEKGQFKFDEFARYMISEHHIKRIDSQLHLYRDGVYISGVLELENAMLKHVPTLSSAKRTEVYKYLDALIREDTATTDPKWIAFKNGLLNIQTDEFVQFTPDVVVTNIIPYDYDPNAYNELTDKTLDRLACNDPAVRSLLEEMAGACLYRRNELAGGKAFILTGAGSNGKSTYLNLIKAMLGKKNISVLDMAKLNDRFSTVMMYGKLANIGDDISDGYIDDSAEFKKIVTGESIDAEYKGRDKFNFEPYVKLIFSANNIPRMGKGRDNSAIIRRLVIIPFNAQFKASDADFVPFIGDKLKEDASVQYLIKLGVAGLKRVLINNAFTASEKVEREIAEFAETNNPILGFFRENEITDIVGQPTKDIYLQYGEYCAGAGINPISRNEFTKQTKKHYGVDVVESRINGVKYRIFKNGR